MNEKKSTQNTSYRLSCPNSYLHNDLLQQSLEGMEIRKISTNPHNWLQIDQFFPMQNTGTNMEFVGNLKLIKVNFFVDSGKRRNYSASVTQKSKS